MKSRDRSLTFKQRIELNLQLGIICKEMNTKSLTKYKVDLGPGKGPGPDLHLHCNIHQLITSSNNSIQTPIKVPKRMPLPDKLSAKATLMFKKDTCLLRLPTILTTENRSFDWPEGGGGKAKTENVKKFVLCYLYNSIRYRCCAPMLHDI